MEVVGRDVDYNHLNRLHVAKIVFQCVWSLCGVTSHKRGPNSQPPNSCRVLLPLDLIIYLFFGP